MSKLAAEIFRDYVNDGVPSSGSHKPIKADIRAWAALLEGRGIPIEAFGGGTGVASNTAAFNAMIDWMSDNSLTQVQFGEGTYTFLTKPNEVTSGIRIRGCGVSQTFIKRAYSEAGGDDVGFITINDAGTGTPNGAALLDLQVFAAAGTSGGTMVVFLTDGDPAGYNRIGCLVTYEATGSFRRCVLVDGSANTTSGSQGLRDIYFDDCMLFAPTTAIEALKLDNVVSAKGTVTTFGAVANAGITITGGAGNALEQSQDIRLNIDCIGMLAVTYARRVQTTGDAYGISYGAEAVDCHHSGLVGDGGYANLNPTGRNLVTSPSTLPASDDTSNSGYANALLNGDFRLGQVDAAASVTLTTSYLPVADRWWAVCGSNPSGTVTTQRLAYDGTRMGLRITRGSGSYASSVAVVQVLESRDCKRFQGRLATVTFRAKRGSAFGGGSCNVIVVTGTGTDQAMSGANASTWTGWSNRGSSGVLALTETDTAFAFTVEIPSSANQIGVILSTGNYSGTGTANDWVHVTHMQIRVGAARTAFEQRPLWVERQLCSYWRKYWPALGTLQVIGSGQLTSTTNARVRVPVGGRMRGTPTLGGDVANMRIYSGDTSFTPTAISFVRLTDFEVEMDLTISGGTNYREARLALAATGTLDINCEL